MGNIFNVCFAESFEDDLDLSQLDLGNAEGDPIWPEEWNSIMKGTSHAIIKVKIRTPLTTTSTKISSAAERPINTRFPIEFADPEILDEYGLRWEYENVILTKHRVLLGLELN